MGWTNQVFNLMPIPAEAIEKIFVPLTDEEKSRLPQVWEKSECQPSQELLPANEEPQRKRILRPSPKEIMASIRPKLEVSDALVSHQEKRIECKDHVDIQTTTRQ